MADINEFLREVEQRKIKFVSLWFTDILGFLKTFRVPVDELAQGLNEGFGFDGSSIEGFTRIDESDMVAIPDPSTFRVIPWSSQDQKTAAMFCDIFTPDLKHYSGDPRYLLKSALQEIGCDHHFYIGPEVEFFLFKIKDNKIETLDKGGYHDTIDNCAAFRAEMAQTLEIMGIPIECDHHEVGPSQNEINLKFCDALEMADRLMVYRFVVREIAKKHGLHATFMPKPLYGENGSGMHTHQSLFRGDKNLFFQEDDKPYHLTPVAKNYIAGLLRYIREISLALNPLVNSYKRLVPGYEAPIYLTWAIRNRSDLIRIPVYKPGKENATRIELRSPDPSCNPYLAFAVMLKAGLAGINSAMRPPQPTEENVYLLTEEERKKRNIKNLPSSLGEAIELAKKSALLKNCLGEHIFTKLIANKEKEWQKYITQVHQFELDEYMPLY